LDAHGIIVPAVTLDDLVAEAGPRSVSLVKIDVQGAEMLVLEGAKRMLGKMRPPLFVEVDDRNLVDMGSSAHALVAHLEQAGYRDPRARNGGPASKALARWALRQFANPLLH